MSNTPARPCTTTALLWQNSLSWISTPSATCLSTGQGYRAQRPTTIRATRYTDHGLTGTSRARPGLREALAACRAGDTLVVTKLYRLARSLPDARDIAD